MKKNNNSLCNQQWWQKTPKATKSYCKNVWVRCSAEMHRTFLITKVFYYPKRINEALFNRQLKQDNLAVKKAYGSEHSPSQAQLMLEIHFHVPFVCFYNMKKNHINYRNTLTMDCFDPSPAV